MNLQYEDAILHIRNAGSYLFFDGLCPICRTVEIHRFYPTGPVMVYRCLQCDLVFRVYPMSRGMIQIGILRGAAYKE